MIIITVTFVFIKVNTFIVYQFIITMKILARTDIYFIVYHYEHVSKDDIYFYSISL